MPILSHWPNWPQELHELHREMRRLFDENLSGFLDRRGSSRRFPPVNVSETDEEILVRAEVPGISVKELDLSVTGETLTLEGERLLELPEGATFLAQERQHGRFRRVVSLPRPVDARETNAEYADGVLTVRLRKAPGARPRIIAVKTG